MAIGKDMNQTKKRLSIINLAISITDIETIQLQILKLGPLRTDTKIQEIISVLQAENYAQAQGLITTYIETPTEEILQRTSQKSNELQKEEDAKTIDEFSLFVTENESKEETTTLDLDDMMAIQNETTNTAIKKEQQTIDFDTLLNVNSDDILPNNIDIDLKHSEDKTFWEEPEEVTLETKDIPKDTFFDEEHAQEITSKEETIQTFHDSIKEDEDEQEELLQEKETTLKEEIPREESPKKDLSKEKTQEEETQNSDNNKSESSNIHYKAIPYIDQKFKNMHVQYPPVVEAEESFPSVDAWLIQISTKGYSEENIEEILQYIDSLGEDRKDEASELLLASAATESKYAQFRLARALYKGTLLQQNPAESFTLINRLANYDDYPEAICDLAQFYEHGIGIDKDKKKATQLYKEAMEMGISRATAHYERITKSKNLFSFLKK